MARQATITDAQILDAALQEFLKDGFGARTSEIARKAGVSEGTIFKRFETKEALFCAALDIPHPASWYALAESLVGEGSARDNLTKILMGIIAHLQIALPRVITKLGSHLGAERPPGADQMAEPPPVRDARILAEYLNREIALGRVRPCRTDLLAKMLLGSAFHYVFGHHAAKRESTPDALEAHVDGIIELIWNGIAPLS
jgi:AcrR family transcriptional regulator